MRAILVLKMLTWLFLFLSVLGFGSIIGGYYTKKFLPIFFGAILIFVTGLIVHYQGFQYISAITTTEITAIQTDIEYVFSYYTAASDISARLVSWMYFIIGVFSLMYAGWGSLFERSESE